MRFRKQKDIVTPIELTDKSKIDVLFVDPSSASKPHLEKNDALLNSDILGAASYLMAKGHSYRLMGLIADTGISPSANKQSPSTTTIEVLGNLSVEIKYLRSYVDAGARLHRGVSGEEILTYIKDAPTVYPHTASDGVTYTAGGITATRGITWLAKGLVLSKTGTGTVTFNGTPYVEETLTLLPGNEDLTIVKSGDTVLSTPGQYTVIYDAKTPEGAIVDTYRLTVVIA